MTSVSSYQPLIISPWSDLSIYGIASVLGLVTMQGMASATYPVANQAVFVPFVVPSFMPAVQMFCANGSAANTGNIDVGLYSPDGTRLVSKGSTAQGGGSDTMQAFAAVYNLAPGLYYMALACDSTSTTFYRGTPTTRLLQALGVFTQTASFPLPATVTFATCASAYLPFFGLSSRSLL